MFISKRAKVVSDKGKPAYTEKEKSESGGDIYRYSPKHIERRWHEKCEKLKRLEKNIDRLRKQYEKDLSSDDLRTRAEAAAVGIIDDTAMRVGNLDSVDEYKTYGATTLKVKHLTFSGQKTTFKFVGKDQVKQDVETSNPKITKVLKELVGDKKDDDFVFEIEGTKIWDRAINRYLDKFDISAKDIRGFQANRIMKEKLKTKDFKEALEETAKEVGHEAATLKNQYLDPHLVEKYTKKASIPLSIRAQEEIPMASQPIQDNINISLNTSNIAPNISSSMNKKLPDDLMRAWAIIAPFLPQGATLTSAYRSDLDQAATALNFWCTVIDWRKPSVTQDWQGFFYRNFNNDQRIRTSQRELSNLYAIVNKKQMGPRTTARINQLIEFMASYAPNKAAPIQGEPKSGISIAKIGESEHRFGTAIDIANAPIDKINKALQFISKNLPGALSLARDPYIEPVNRVVHVEFSGQVKMPDENVFRKALLEKRMEDEKANIPINPAKPIKASLSKRALFDKDDDAQWLEQLRPTVLIPRQKQFMLGKDYAQTGINPNVKLTPFILAAWQTLRPFLPKDAVMTSGARTAEDQKRILRNYWSVAGLTTETPGYGDYYAMSKILYQNGYVVGPPTTNYPYAHLHGTALDINSSNLDEIAEAVNFVNNTPSLNTKFVNMIIERKNNDVHVGIMKANYDPDAIAKALNERSGPTQIASVDKDLFIAFGDCCVPELSTRTMNIESIIDIGSPISKLSEEKQKKEIIEDLMKSDAPEEIKEVFDEQTADDKIKIELGPQEQKIFDLLKEVKKYYGLKCELRVVGGWVRDKLLEQTKLKEMEIL